MDLAAYSAHRAWHSLLSSWCILGPESRQTLHLWREPHSYPLCRGVFVVQVDSHFSTDPTCRSGVKEYILNFPRPIIRFTATLRLHSTEMAAVRVPPSAQARRSRCERVLPNRSGRRHSEDDQSNVEFLSSSADFPGTLFALWGGRPGIRLLRGQPTGATTGHPFGDRRSARPHTGLWSGRFNDCTALQVGQWVRGNDQGSCCEALMGFSRHSIVLLYGIKSPNESGRTLHHWC